LPSGNWTNIRLLEGEGIKVRRPDVVDFAFRYRCPDWSSRGFCVACPRDVFLIIGDEIIETPTCWRSRYFEADAYRSLFKEYFLKGAKLLFGQTAASIARA
jgi:glycine amidinotransferase